LAKKEGKKQLHVRFSGTPQRLCVRVEDNGTGRQTGPKEDELERTELGIANVRQRLVLLQGKSVKTDPVIITDLVVDGKPGGVRIDLVIILSKKKNN
jgi:LytS/YehU family sensor histidine kinase